MDDQFYMVRPIDQATGNTISREPGTTIGPVASPVLVHKGMSIMVRAL